MNDAVSPSSLCSACGVALPTEGTGGLCPACLMDAVMQPTNDQGKPWQPPAAADLAALLPQYEIECLLGRGGMGAVYKGRHLDLDREVAIKILPPDLISGDHDFAGRFKQEARAMAKLKHPGIVAVHDFGQTADGLLYFVMEFVEGMDVQEMMVREGRLHTADALAIAAHVCDALAYAHQRGVIHRDIKPANVIVAYDGHVKVADFGLAKFTNTADNSGFTLQGSVMGTPNYMAPEALLFDTSVDERADIYAVGVMLYQMLTGKVPRGVFEMPSLQVPGLDPRLDGIIVKAMREDREQRYPHATDLRADLNGVLTQPMAQTILVPREARPGNESEPLRVHPSQVRLARVPSGEDSHGSAAPHQDPTELMLKTTHSLNTTILVLGCTALLVLGAVAFFLANRKTGDVYNTEQTITTSETHNTYFTQIIAAGLASASDLASIADIRPYADHFIGITKAPLSWERAQDLARQAGAEILPIGDKADGTQAQLLAWLVTSYSSELSTSVWVSQGGEPRVLNGLDITETVNQETESKVILQWEKPSPESEASPVPSVPPTTTPSPKPAEAPPATSPTPVVPNTSEKPAAPSETLEWTSNDGRAIRAAFVKLSGESVVIRREDGQLFTVPFSTLAPASIEQAMKLGRQAK